MAMEGLGVPTPSFPLLRKTPPLALALSGAALKSFVVVLSGVRVIFGWVWVVLEEFGVVLGVLRCLWRVFGGSWTVLWRVFAESEAVLR